MLSVVFICQNDGGEHGDDNRKNRLDDRQSHLPSLTSVRLRSADHQSGVFHLA